MIDRIRASHALLLQGPNGPFFRRLADDLQHANVRVTKVNFHSGDDLMYRGPEVMRFRAPMSEWPAFVRDLLSGGEIDAVILFGDCRPIHRVAIRVAGELNVPVWVFEEGYLRPHFVTLEQGGVNGNTSIPRDPDVFRRAPAELPPMPAPEPVGNTFSHQTLWTILNSCAVTFGWWRHPRYHHHRNINSFQQAYVWVRGGARKLWYRQLEKGYMERLTGELDGHFFLVALQVHCDAQVRHSVFADVEEFIEQVISVFAREAPESVHLVFKHHPHDRPYRDYTRLLKKLSKRYGVSRRVLYVHDLHLPTLLKRARGLITINSTVGISSMFHGTPVKVLGEAVYDIPGLTSQGTLGEFFQRPGWVDTELFEGFQRWLRHHNQFNGSFYRRLASPGNSTGIVEGPEASSDAAAQGSRLAAR